MLSVLSSGTLNLSGELANVRLELNRQRSENAGLRDKFHRRSSAAIQHYTTAIVGFASRDEHMLKQMVFRALKRCRAQEQSERKTGELETLLTLERQRSAGLEAELLHSRAQFSELQSTLKDSYIRQFQATQQRDTLERHFSTLHGDHQRLKGDRCVGSQELRQYREELARSESACADQEMRLVEASEELILAESVIEDLISSKCIGLKRFFQKYNMPLVVVSFFRKIVELQGMLRRRDAGLSRTSLSHGSLRGGESSAPTSPLHSSPSSPVCGSFPPTSPACGGAAAAIVEAEVRQHICLHGEASVSRHELQAYVESLRLPLQVAPGMVAQVLLALLGLDPGEGCSSCDMSRFLGMLLSPPAWEQQEFATAMWGAIGEPAAAIVQQHRRRNGWDLDVKKPNGLQATSRNSRSMPPASARVSCSGRGQPGRARLAGSGPAMRRGMS